MTTLTVSGSAAGQTTTVWMRSPVVRVEPVAGWPARVGLRLAGDLGPVRGPGARRVEVGDRVGGQARRLEDDEGRRPVAAEVPRAAGEADLVDAGVGQAAEVLGRAVAARVERVRAAALVGRRDERLELRVGARRGAVGRARRRSDRTTAARHRRSARRQREQGEQRAAARERSMGHGPEAYGRPAANAVTAGGRAVVRPGTWYGRPRVVRRVRPTIDPGRTGRGAIALVGHEAYRSAYADPRSNRGQTWGVGHGSGNGRFSRGGSREGSRIQVTSRVTGSSAIRPGRPSGRQRSSHIWRATIISGPIALRYRGAISRLRAVRA